MDKEIIEKYFKDGETAQNTLEELGLFEQVAKQYILTRDMEVINYFLSLRPNEKENEMKYNHEIVGRQYEIREIIILNWIEYFTSDEKEREDMRINLQHYLQQEIWVELEGMILKEKEEECKQH